MSSWYDLVVLGPGMMNYFDKSLCLWKFLKPAPRIKSIFMQYKVRLCVVVHILQMVKYDVRERLRLSEVQSVPMSARRN